MSLILVVTLNFFMSRSSPIGIEPPDATVTGSAVGVDGNGVVEGLVGTVVFVEVGGKVVFVGVGGTAVFVDVGGKAVFVGVGGTAVFVGVGGRAVLVGVGTDGKLAGSPGKVSELNSCIFLNPSPSESRFSIKPNAALFLPFAL